MAQDFVTFDGMNLSDHKFQVPLFWDETNRPEKIEIFVRKVWVTLQTESSQFPSDSKYLVYLQGGPGFQSPRPQSLAGWMKAAISLGYIVLLLDQRGTGILEVFLNKLCPLMFR
jgi:hypothetical protein